MALCPALADCGGCFKGSRAALLPACGFFVGVLVLDEGSKSVVRRWPRGGSEMRLVGGVKRWVMLGTVCMAIWRHRLKSGYAF